MSNRKLQDQFALDNLREAEIQGNGHSVCNEKTNTRTNLNDIHAKLREAIEAGDFDNASAALADAKALSVGYPDQSLHNAHDALQGAFDEIKDDGEAAAFNNELLSEAQ